MVGVSPHEEGALKLQNLDAFMQILGDIFEDPTAAWHAETCICSMRQGKQMMAQVYAGLPAGLLFRRA